MGYNDEECVEDCKSSNGPRDEDDLLTDNPNDNYLKEHILTISNSILEQQDNRLSFDSRSFTPIINLLIDDEARTDIVCLICDDLLSLKRGDIPKYNFSLGFNIEHSESLVRSVFESLNWLYLGNSTCEVKRALFAEIDNSLYEGKTQERLKKEKIGKKYFSIDSDNFESFINRVDNLSLYNSMGLKQIYAEKIKLEKQKFKKNQKVPEAFRKIQEVFDLTDIQQKILFFYYIRANVSKFHEFLNYSKFDYYYKNKAIYAFSEFFSVTQHVIQKEFRRNSKLIQAMLLCISDNSVCLSYHINDFLQSEDNSTDIFSYFFEKLDLDKTLDIKSHRTSEEELEAISNLLSSKKGSNLLLYGDPGTGKSEFARSLGVTHDLEIYRVREHDDEEFNMVQKKRSSLEAAKNMLQPNSILVVDEAEQILCSGGGGSDTSDHKAWLNTYIENHDINIVWITNDMTMHQSTKRRFDLSIKFNPFTRSQRFEALKNIQKDNEIKLFDDKELMDLAKEYVLNPGMLSLPFKKVSSFDLDLKKKKELTFTLLESQMKLLADKSFSEKELEKFYDPTIVNTSMPEKDICGAIDSYFREGHTRNLCILFQGIPGTGKTEYARYLADKLEKELSVKRASDIVSKWVGETEQNIAKVFRETEAEGDILFLDECDSLFVERQSAERSWQVSETNELLTQMERFKGVLICATNFVANLDRAAMRRFHLKVEFKDLKPDAIMKLYKKFFTELAGKRIPLPEQQRLKNMKNLNPGDFKAVYNGIVFKRKLKHSEIISKLEEELKYKKDKRPISLS